jgi:hypothetical protein
MGFIMRNAVPGDVDITVSAEATNVITVTLQAKEIDRNVDFEGRVLLDIMLLPSSWGNNAGVGVGGGISVTTGVLAATLIDNNYIRVITDTDGQAVMTLTQAGAATFFMVVQCGGLVLQSATITFAA